MEKTYSEAINEGLDQAMELDENVILLGQLVDCIPGIFGTTIGLVEKYGPDRVQDFPISENLMTFAALGASLTGARPIIVHQRLDFMIYSLDAIVNWLSLWYFKSNKESNVPVTIRAIVGKGWGQGPQHSKSLHAWFGHLPGLQVAVPSTAHDVKGLLLESIFGENPSIIIEHRSLFSMSDDVSEVPYRVKFGQALVRERGTDMTVVAIGAMVPLALQAAEVLRKEGISLEVVDLRTISPMDTETIFRSVAHTGRLAVLDLDWKSIGVASEIITLVCEQMMETLKARPLRICLPDSHTPMSGALEAVYYPDLNRVVDEIRRALT
jgi:pyruvate/2-oxoglutarate/acetoin dehydrogenase E1 component